MFVGAISAIYLLSHGVSLTQFSFIKAFQAIILICLGFFLGVISDSTNRKYILIFAIMFSFISLLLLYIAGLQNNLLIFYIAEFFNSLSLIFDHSNSNSYILDQYKIDTSNKKFEIPLGEVDAYSFLGIAIFSITGGFLYNYIGIHIFMVSSMMMFIMFILSYFILPIQHPNHRTTNKIYKYNHVAIHIKIILRKYKKNCFFIFGYLFINLIFQMFIQYWQPLVLEVSLINKNISYIGCVMFCIMLIQSFSGKLTQKYSPRPIAWIVTPILLLFGVFLWYKSTVLDINISFVVGMLITFGSGRYIITITNAYIHKGVISKFRAKYDSILNTILRLLTAIVMISAGFLTQRYNVNIIFLLTIILSVVLLLVFIIPISINRCKFFKEQ